MSDQSELSKPLAVVLGGLLFLSVLVLPVAAVLLLFHHRFGFWLVIAALAYRVLVALGGYVMARFVKPS